MWFKAAHFGLDANLSLLNQKLHLELRTLGGWLFRGQEQAADAEVPNGRDVVVFWCAPVRPHSITCVEAGNLAPTNRSQWLKTLHTTTVTLPRDCAGLTLPKLARRYARGCGARWRANEPRLAREGKERTKAKTVILQREKPLAAHECLSGGGMNDAAVEMRHAPRLPWP